jgi:hypothetical protein
MDIKEITMKKTILLSLILGIILPWILIFIFLSLMTDINWTQMTGGFPQILSILSFSSVSFPHSIPIFGYGYTIPLFIWLVTGIICGLFAKSALKGALITFVGLFINVLIFAILTTMDPTFIPEGLIAAENVGLIGGFSMDFFVTLGLFLFMYSLTAPASLLGGIMGGLISRSGVVE